MLSKLFSGETTQHLCIIATNNKNIAFVFVDKPDKLNDQWQLKNHGVWFT